MQANTAAAVAAGLHAEGCKWDARRLPLRSGCVDFIVSDLPFGVRCNAGKSGYVLKFLRKLVGEIGRVLCAQGKAILLCNHPAREDEMLRQA